MNGFMSTSDVRRMALRNKVLCRMDGGERVAFIKVETLFSYGRTARFMYAVIAGLCLLIGLNALVFGMFGMPVSVAVIIMFIGAGCLTALNHPTRTARIDWAVFEKDYDVSVLNVFNDRKSAIVRFVRNCEPVIIYESNNGSRHIARLSLEAGNPFKADVYEMTMEPCWHAFMDVQLKYIRKGMNNGIIGQE